MAAPEEVHAPEVEHAGKPGMTPIMMIGIGAGVFILQTVLVYLLIVFVLVPKFSGAGGHEKAEKTETKEETPADSKTSGQFVYVVKDLIINPAGTGGTRFLLTTVGVETGNEEELKSVEKKDVVVRDVLNTILASKSVEALDDQTKREGLRKEIRDSLQKSIRPEKITQVYFSKFIIQ
jgi:flagellar protein FliL